MEQGRCKDRNTPRAGTPSFGGHGNPPRAGTPNFSSHGNSSRNSPFRTDQVMENQPQLQSPTSPTSPDGQSQVLRDQGNFIQNVSQFYNQESLSDILLKVGDQSYFGHKFVLAKSSEVFRTMLYDNRFVQSTNSGVLELNESPESYLVFDKFLRFLYTAEISINVEIAVGVLCLADKYNVISLKNLCTQYMVENTRSPKVHNALNWYSWAKVLNLTDLIEQCALTIAWNAEGILQSTEWLQMDIDFVFDILSKSDLVLQNEFQLYCAVVEWLTNDSHKANFVTNAQRLLPLLRFPQLMVTQLYDIEVSEFAQRKECKSIIHELLGKAYRFRSLCPSQNSVNVSFQEDFYMPRNYTHLVVDTVRMQNTLRFGIQVDVRTYVGPVPSISKEGDWKITYRKNMDCWSLQIYCHESAMIAGEAHIQATVIIYNPEDKVIQVEQTDNFICTRGNNLALSVNVAYPEESKTMAVVIKPVPE